MENLKLPKIFIPSLQASSGDEKFRQASITVCLNSIEHFKSRLSTIIDKRLDLLNERQNKMAKMIKCIQTNIENNNVKILKFPKTLPESTVGNKKVFGHLDVCESEEIEIYTRKSLNYVFCTNILELSSVRFILYYNLEL
jgi:hypothetical protein